MSSEPIALDDNAVYIASAVRTPLGAMGGSLASFSATQLGGFAVKAAVERAGIDAALVEEVYGGNVLSAGVGQAPARQAAIYGGLPKSTVCTTVNKVCASGTKAIMLAANAIKLGQASVVVAVGMESMSNVPYFLKKARDGYRLGHGELTDGLIHDGLWDPYGNIHMGSCAEKTATDYSLSREDQDNWALLSYQRAAESTKEGKFKDEIVPVSVAGPRGKPATLVSEDEAFKKLDTARFTSLRPVFKEGGTITAANASPISDGAAALVLVSGKKAKELGLKPIGKILGYADAEHEPIDFPTAPALALPKAVANASISMEDVEYFEINEAFAVAALSNQKILNIPTERLNVFGGAVALGHPIGCSGARIVVTVLSVLKDKGAKIGAVSICNGGGGASALVVERL
eukprot:TRINITY_DN2_c0_g1_i1.p1 TRINITY_DN2_c0_g1~~TRINITY_DN2_c0_g1_i1.p1  ORF type:complete len:403 (-),score=96.45 TRINITY_DN2_c0_g1_i1:190-1398(-)